MNNILLGLLNITLTMSIVIAILMLTRETMKKRITAKSRFIIWTLILIRLCIPFTLLNMSFFNIDIPQETSEIRTHYYDNQVVPPIGSSTPNANGNISTDEEDTPETVITLLKPNLQSSGMIVVSKPSENNESTVNKIINSLKTNTELYIFVIWLFGAIFSFSYGLFNYNMTARKLNASLSSPNETLSELYSRVKTEMGIKRGPKLYISPNISSPMVYGYFSKKLLLPEIELDENSIEKIYRHELTHIKRGDLYIKLISLLGNSVHWFNPLAYIAAKAHASEMELSCDEVVLKSCTEEERLSYGNAMLTVVRSTRNNISSLTTNFNPTPGKLKERFNNILDMNKKKKGLIIICTIILICAVSATVIGISMTNKKAWTKLNDISDDYSLYYDESSRDGIKYDMKLEYKEKEITFRGKLPIRDRNNVLETDVNGDETSDIILTICEETGTAISVNTPYIFDGITLSEIPVEDVISQLQQRIKFTSDDNYFYLTIDKEQYTFDKDLIDTEKWGELSKNIYFGQFEEYFTDEDGLYFKTVCYCNESGTYGPGNIIVRFVCDNGKLMVDKTAFEETKNAEETITYETSDPNWQMFYKNDYLILKSNSGKRIVYDNLYSRDGNASLYNYKFDPNAPLYAHIFQEYALVTCVEVDSESISSRVIAFDLKNQTSLSSYSINTHILYMYHNLPKGILDDYFGTEDEAPKCSMSVDVKPIDGTVFELYYTCVTDDGKINLLTLVNFDVTKGLHQYTPLKTEISDDVPYCNSVNNINDIDKIEEVYENCAEAVKAFINKDLKKLEKMTYYLYEEETKGRYEFFNDIRFGNYIIERYDGDFLKLVIEFTESNNELFPKGTHEFIFYDRMDTVIFQHNCKIEYDADNPAVEEISSYFDISPDYHIYRANENPYDREEYEMNCYTYLGLRYGEMTKAEYKALAYKIFGIEDLHPAEFDKYDDSEKFVHFIGGLFVRSYRIVKAWEVNGIYSVQVQFYGDYGYITPSDLITYSFRFEDGIAIAEGMTFDYDSDVPVASFKI